MQTNNLTVPLFLFGAALTVAVCGITIAGWKHKLLVWGLLSVAALLALLAIFWGPVSTAVPAVGDTVGAVASAQVIWFLAIVAALASTISSNLKVKRLRSSSSTDLAVIDREFKAHRALEDRLEKLEEGQKRIQERLEGAQVVAGVLEAHGRGSVGANPTHKLTGVERERASAALCETVDFVTEQVHPFYTELCETLSVGVANIARKANTLQPERERLAKLSNELWHKHSYYFELMEFDMMPLLRTLEALNAALHGAAEAQDWPLNAQADRASPVSQFMSDLGGSIGNVRKDAAEKRKEYLE